VTRLPRAEQAAQRRHQIIIAAAAIIQNRGLDALKHGQVAEEVGCARTLVYKYFPTLDDLLMAVMVDWYERLDRHMAVEGQVLGVTDSINRHDYDDVELVDLVWKTVCESGRAAIMLRNFMGSGFVLGDRLEEFQATYESRWDLALSAAGFDPVKVQIVKECGMTAVIQLHKTYTQGEIDYDQGRELLRDILSSMVEGLVPS